jgi:lysozyme family protein
MTNIVALKAKNAARWQTCQITPSRLAEVHAVSLRLTAPAAKTRYQAVEKATGVPWFIVAVIHEREASQSWNAQLGQGDPLAHASIHVPKGRGPFLFHAGDIPGNDAWHRAAVDALMNCPPQAGHWKDWTVGGSLTILVLYNGTGTEDYHNEPSPYDWGATNIEQRGKYVQDGIFSASVWDVQIGCAAMLKAMMALDTSIKFAEAA